MLEESEELEELDLELKQIYSQVDKAIEELKKECEETTLSYVEVRIARAKDVLAAYKGALRGLSPTTKAPYLINAEEHQKKIFQLISDVNWCKGYEWRKGKEEPRSVELMSTEMLLKKGADTQDESIRSLDRTNAMIQQSQQIGSEVCIQLTQHGERINTVGSGVEEVESNLEQGKVVLKAFARRMATDRITMALLMIIVVCVLTILVIAVLFPRSKEVNQDTIHPT